MGSVRGASVILVLKEGLALDGVQRIEAAVRRAGGDPKRLFGSVAAGATSGHDAIEARFEAREETKEELGRLPGVAFVLEAKCSYPRVGRSARAGETRAVLVHGAKIGGAEIVLVAGPCAVENAEQLEASARAARDAGAKVLRGGAFKPRTSPYSFQGLGEAGLVLLRTTADRLGLGVVTEVLDTESVGLVAEHADMLQVGSRNMQNTALLRAVGRQSRPVLLKRGMSATLEEWLLAAEYIADAGNENIVLCERGVRSFDPAARNLLDLAAVPLLRERTSLPIFVDPSHGVGVRSAIAAASLAAIAAGADGLILECHADPGVAKSDGFQALSPAELVSLGGRMRKVAVAVGRS
jgi:3-deoxy-7-phosphoheptulonate synthase